MVKVRVLLVDDDPLVRAGLHMMLSSSERLDVVGEAADGAEAVAAIHECRPDVVLMDIRMPEMDGIAATSAIRSLPKPPYVIVLTTFQADDQVLGALRAGADGFLLKDTPPTEIVNAVLQVAAGEAMLSPSVTRTLLSHLGNDELADRRKLAAERLTSLTDREREVADAVGSGASNADIAASLFMSEATVKAHVSRLLTKLGVSNRVQVAILVHDAQRRARHFETTQRQNLRSQTHDTSMIPGEAVLHTFRCCCTRWLAVHTLLPSRHGDVSDLAARAFRQWRSATPDRSQPLPAADRCARPGAVGVSRTCRVGL